VEGVLDFAVPLAAGPDVELIEPDVGAGLLQVGGEARGEGGVFAGVAEKGGGFVEGMEMWPPRDLERR
jgi:hypothetical protein